MPLLAHWDDVEPRRAEVGHLAGSWRDLGLAAGTVNVGVKRIQVDPGKWSTPAHVQGAEEEIFYVLGGSGLSWQDGSTYEVGEGDCLVHLAGHEVHTLRAGRDGLDVLAFGSRVWVEVGHLPRAGIGWLWPTWTEVGGGETPWQREVAAGEPETPEPSKRPPNIVNLADVPDDGREGATVGRVRRNLGRSAGSQRTGLQHVTVSPDRLQAPPHCHSAEEEIFVILDGEGLLELTPSGEAVRHGAGSAEHPVRRGHVVSRPAGTGVAHAFRAGPGGLTLLAYGTREPNDIAYYPRSQKLFWRGAGLIARVEHVDYWDGED